MPFTLTPTPLPGLLVVQPTAFGDARGFFKETYNQRDFADLGLPTHWDQDNVSLSCRGTVRGLHYQAPPHAQGKLVQALRGHVRDVVVDIRRSSPTYGQHFAIDLTGENHTLLWVPPGFAHGFAVLSPEALFCYKVTGLYHKAAEGGLRWDCPTLGIDWGLPAAEAILSEKDRLLPGLAEFESPFA
jgi:dTDP-4-dehydrorhamnose 3,5-epimerase